MPVFQLVTRQSCHLCEEMQAVLDAELPSHDLGYEAVDVDSDPLLRKRFSDVVPVLLRDGKPVAKIRLDRERLRRLIARRRGFSVADRLWRDGPGSS